MRPFQLIFARLIPICFYKKAILSDVACSLACPTISRYIVGKCTRFTFVFKLYSKLESIIKITVVYFDFIDVHDSYVRFAFSIVNIFLEKAILSVTTCTLNCTTIGTKAFGKNKLFNILFQIVLTIGIDHSYN